MLDDGCIQCQKRLSGCEQASWGLPGLACMQAGHKAAYSGPGTVWNCPMLTVTWPCTLCSTCALLTCLLQSMFLDKLMVWRGSVGLCRCLDFLSNASAAPRALPGGVPARAAVPIKSPNWRNHWSVSLCNQHASQQGVLSIAAETGHAAGYSAPRANQGYIINQRLRLQPAVLKPPSELWDLFHICCDDNCFSALLLCCVDTVPGACEQAFCSQVVCPGVWLHLVF